MSPPWDVLGVGAAMGGAVGIFAGYQLRKLVVHIQEYRAYRSSKRSAKAYAQVSSLEEAERDKAYFEKRKRDLGIIPIQRAKRQTPKTPVEVPVNPDRDDVIAALMGTGFSKADAVKAADACSMVERASGLEAWTRAALTNAARKP